MKKYCGREGGREGDREGSKGDGGRERGREVEGKERIKAVKDKKNL